MLGWGVRAMITLITVMTYLPQLKLVYNLSFEKLTGKRHLPPDHAGGMPGIPTHYYNHTEYYKYLVLLV